MQNYINATMNNVNVHCANVVGMPNRVGTAGKRLQGLLEELVAEQVKERGGKERGAQSAVVKRLAIDQSQFNRALRGEVGFGVEKLETVVQKLRLRWDYFFGPVEPATYRDFLGDRYRALTDFMATDEGRATNPDERAFLASCTFLAGAPDVATYRALLAAYRGTYGYRVPVVAAPSGEWGEGDIDQSVDAVIAKNPGKKGARKAKPSASPKGVSGA